MWIKIAILLLAISIIISWISWLRLSNKINTISNTVSHQQDLINKLTWESIINSDWLKDMKWEIYRPEIAKAMEIIDNAWYDLSSWDFETKYSNDIVLVNKFRNSEIYICVNTMNKIIMANCTYFK